MAIGRSKLREEGIVEDAQRTGIMVAFYLPPTTANGLALTSDRLPEGSEVLAANDLHLTLAYLGETKDQIEPVESLYGPLSALAKGQTPLTGKINGIGTFGTTSGPDNMRPLWATADVPGLAEFRQVLVVALTDAGFQVSEDHGFTPHVTLAYVPADRGGVEMDPPDAKVTFDTLSLAWGERIIAYTLGSGIMTESRKIIDTFARSVTEAKVTHDQERKGCYLLSGVVIAEGLSANGNFYTRDALQSGIEAFSGKPIYADHPSRSEESDRPERSVRDLVGRLSGEPSDFWLEEGETTLLRFKNARLSSTAGWLATMIEEKIAGDMSINAMGSGEEKDRTFHVTEFTEATSLDFVTQAAAGGIGLLAAGRGGQSLQDLTLRALASARPDLVDAIGVRERRKAYGEKDELVTQTRQLRDVTARAETAELALRESQARAMLDRLLVSSNLPPRAQARVRKLLEAPVAQYVSGDTTRSLRAASGDFKPGDRVEVTAGQYKGEKGKIVEEHGDTWLVAIDGAGDRKLTGDQIKKVSAASRSREARGQGMGVGGPRQGDFGASTCVCPECGAKVSHPKGTPCLDLKCPKCGAAMQGVDGETAPPDKEKSPPDKDAITAALHRRTTFEAAKRQAWAELESLTAARPDEAGRVLAETVAEHLGLCNLEGRTPDWLYRMGRRVTREAMTAYDYIKAYPDVAHEWIDWLSYEKNVAPESEREEQEWYELEQEWNEGKGAKEIRRGRHERRSRPSAGIG